jgi:hypothetical protein
MTNATSGAPAIHRARKRQEMSPLYLEYMMREDACEREEWGQERKGAERARREAGPRFSSPVGGLRRHLARGLISLGLHLDLEGS